MHELRDAINLEWFSQVPSSLFPANLRELALILPKNSNSKIESSLSKRNRKQDHSLWVGMMTTDAPSLVSFFEMLYCRRTIMLDPHHGRDPACPQSSLLSRLTLTWSQNCPVVEESHDSVFFQTAFLESATNFILYSLFCLGCPLLRVFEPSWVFHFFQFFIYFPSFA